MNIFTRILTNNWFAAVVLILAGAGLYMLYLKGMILESAVGGLILVLALVLIIKGGKKPPELP